MIYIIAYCFFFFENYNNNSPDELFITRTSFKLTRFHLIKTHFFFSSSSSSCSILVEYLILIYEINNKITWNYLNVCNVNGNIHKNGIINILVSRIFCSFTWKYLFHLISHTSVVKEQQWAREWNPIFIALQMGTLFRYKRRRRIT